MPLTLDDDLLERILAALRRELQNAEVTAELETLAQSSRSPTRRLPSVSRSRSRSRGRSSTLVGAGPPTSSTRHALSTSHPALSNSWPSPSPTAVGSSIAQSTVSRASTLTPLSYSLSITPLPDADVSDVCPSKSLLLGTVDSPRSQAMETEGTDKSADQEGVSEADVRRTSSRLTAAAAGDGGGGGGGGNGGGRRVVPRKSCLARGGTRRKRRKMGAGNGINVGGGPLNLGEDEGKCEDEGEGEDEGEDEVEEQEENNDGGNGEEERAGEDGNSQARVAGSSASYLSAASRGRGKRGRTYRTDGSPPPPTEKAGALITEMALISNTANQLSLCRLLRDIATSAPVFSSNIQPSMECIQEVLKSCEELKKLEDLCSYQQMLSLV
ncbi:hypothetical protein PLICRDRAFT_172406 [Plicaturopsis crispa FD-325 SS-3]|nr:hypothetical protein PLICRDRAFT_172406 [Plicaturopsis crispa FD-325 SS-3]